MTSTDPDVLATAFARQASPIPSEAADAMLPRRTELRIDRSTFVSTSENTGEVVAGVPGDESTDLRLLISIGGEATWAIVGTAPITTGGPPLDSSPPAVEPQA